MYIGIDWNLPTGIKENLQMTSRTKMAPHFYKFEFHFVSKFKL